LALLGTSRKAGKEDMKTQKEIVKELEATLQCNCDLGNWEPERDTGHSWVCRIHKQAKTRFRNQPNVKDEGRGIPRTSPSDCSGGTR